MRARRDTDDRLLAPLRRHRRWTVLGLLIAASAAIAQFYAIGILPPSLKTKALARAEATATVVVGQASRLTPTARDSYTTLTAQRAYALADMVASPEITDYVAREAGLPASKIGVLAPLWTDQWRVIEWPTGPKRSSQIVMAREPYQITITQEAAVAPWSPAIGVYTEAPSTEAAARLASAVATGLNAFLQQLQSSDNTPQQDRLDASQLGPVSVVPPRRSQLANIAIFTFFAVFVLWCGAVIAASSLARDLRAIATASKVRGNAERLFADGSFLKTQLTPQPERIRQL